MSRFLNIMRTGGISVADREKVTRGLERFIDDFKPFCGNRDDWQRVYDALALLKEQEEKIASLQTTINRLHEGIQKAVKWNA